MSAATSPVSTAEEPAAEDLARAHWYSFFARWLLAPPDQKSMDLLVASRGASDAGSAAPGSDLEQAWEAFAAAASGSSLAAMRAAYDDTFISVGEAPVSLHACVYLTGFSNERPLAEVRQWLAGHGIRSTHGGLLTEDHLGLLCEAMAWLIVGEHNGEHSVDRSVDHDEDEDAQQDLFQQYIAPACGNFCRRLGETPGAGVYRELGRLFEAFIAVERQAFDIER